MTLTTRTASDWEATFDSISDGVLLLDAARRIVRLNRAAAKTLGTSRAEAEGSRLRDLLDLADLDDPDLWTGTDHVRLEATTGARWLELTFDPLGSAGARDGTVVTISDVTDRKQIDLALAKALQQQQ